MEGDLVLEFAKFQALGNDYILINGFKYPEVVERASELAVRLSHRHFGIGGDGIIFALPSSVADIRMRIFNADGSEAEMCGNGIRQLVVYGIEERLISGERFAVETLAGLKEVDVFYVGNRIKSLRVNMGKPILVPSKIPANLDLNRGEYSTLEANIVDRRFEFTVVSMGNPHAVTFVDNVDAIDVKKYGSVVENMVEIFPNRVNVEFVEVLSRSELKMRVWERGSGETMACGTGACASVVASVLNGFTDNRVEVNLLGGKLFIEWNNTVFMSGDATRVFDGRVEI